jgi:hypothetical protein
MLTIYRFFQKWVKHFKKGGFPLQIVKCYEALGNNELALDYFIQSAEIRKVDPEGGLDNIQTKTSVENANCIAKEMGKENELPEWMRKMK